MTHDIKNTVTNLRLVFFSHLKTIPRKYDEMLSKAMIAYNITESINEIGTFQIQLKDVLNLHSLIKPGDWVAIWSSPDNSLDMKDKKYLRMVGQIDRPADNKQIMADGKPSDSWIITGKDWSKMFEATQLFYNPYRTIEADKRLNAIDLLLFGDQEKIDNRSPSVYIKHYIDTMWGKKGLSQLYVPILPVGLSRVLNKGQELYKNISFNISPTLGYCTYMAMPFGQMTSLWDMMKSASNHPFNEMYSYIRDGQMQFHFRKSIYTINELFRFAKSQAKTLDAHIVSYNLGLSDYERVNCVLVHGTSAMSVQIENATAWRSGVLIDKTSVERYGLRKMEITTKFAHPKAGQQFSGHNTYLIEQFRDVLKDYGFNKWAFLNGPIVIKGNNTYRVGDWIKFDYKGTEIIAKVEGVTEDWAWGNTITCVLALSHGFDAKGKLYDGGLDDGTHTFHQFNG